MVLLEIQVQFPQVLVQGSQVQVQVQADQVQVQVQAKQVQVQVQAEQVQVQVQAEQVQVQGRRARLVRVLVFILRVMMRRFHQGRGSPSGFRRL
jgi:hypothetical protein